MTLNLQPYSFGIKKFIILLFVSFFAWETSFAQSSIFTSQTPVIHAKRDIYLYNEFGKFLFG